MAHPSKRQSLPSLPSDKTSSTPTRPSLSYASVTSHNPSASLSRSYSADPITNSRPAGFQSPPGTRWPNSSSSSGNSFPPITPTSSVTSNLHGSLHHASPLSFASMAASTTSPTSPFFLPSPQNSSGTATVSHATGVFARQGEYFSLTRQSQRNFERSQILGDNDYGVEPYIEAADCPRDAFVPIPPPPSLESQPPGILSQCELDRVESMLQGGVDWSKPDAEALQALLNGLSDTIRSHRSLEKVVKSMRERNTRMEASDRAMRMMLSSLSIAVWVMAVRGLYDDLGDRLEKSGQSKPITQVEEIATWMSLHRESPGDFDYRQYKLQMFRNCVSHHQWRNYIVWYIERSCSYHGQALNVPWDSRGMDPLLQLLLAFLVAQNSYVRLLVVSKRAWAEKEEDKAKVTVTIQEIIDSISRYTSLL